MLINNPIEDRAYQIQAGHVSKDVIGFAVLIEIEINPIIFTLSTCIFNKWKDLDEAELPLILLFNLQEQHKFL